jgi:primary-amine oxidase
VTANQLSLGCDCLGYIKYFDGFRADSKGNPILLKNVVCLHEQDGGLQHKHTNYRNGKATVVRNRQLVVQMICTLANYEYAFSWTFDQAAGINFETRATGILSTAPMSSEEEGFTVPWATNVGPGVVAPFHQHIFSLRIDPAIDGYKNTVFYEDSVPLPVDDTLNPYGIGYGVEKTTIKKAGTARTSVDRHRVFKIRNDAIINSVSHKPVAYAIHTAPSQMILMAKTSFNAKRAAFAQEPVWVTKYQDDELYAAGEFTNQSREDTGLGVWARRDDDVENDDVVFWHCKSQLKPLPLTAAILRAREADNTCSIRPYPQPKAGGLPSHASGASQHRPQAQRLLHQEP